MFAVIRTGGKQYRVEEGARITVERLAGSPGEVVAIRDVLMLGGDGEARVKAESLSSAAVFAEVLEQTRGEKIIIFKKRRRKNYRRRTGHRQNLTVLKITGISAEGAAPGIVAAAGEPALQADLATPAASAAAAPDQE